MISFTVDEYTVYSHLKSKMVLEEPNLPFSSVWLYSKIINEQRFAEIPLMLESAFDMAIAGLVKKLILRHAYSDRYYFLDIVTSL